MNEELFRDFYLVGGTSLSLQIGHRNSIDIDLFGNCEINQNEFIEKLKEYGDVIVIQSTKNILITEINGIKVDFVNYKYPLLSEPIIEDKIRMLSKIDISAMKLNAIAGRGSKKDFIDLFFLLNEFTLKEIIAFYLQKYSDGSEFMVQKSLTYFEDADDQLNPKMLHKSFNWEACKQKIIQEVLKLN
ncbi:nucleotidyl transferase AbiEii/AbiGii toxin family protein [Flavobacterium agrisoli]|uniref:Nucleotidyl transferase AbiEii/AbiGii toxin family protein n=1 Tax=Flavobacterium agrisoli TaxID=2793066 RepID=A0A934PNF8_9FLAO|nr:nucleotidyl transferase AbiEii/AbiGii toxin family protein [Flavobacterium agrisoli]MBK0369628.1 nucleotidyl transferase AbiEii/AbiGii toxin family protein [Flavobacterium agrisoli]